MFNATFFIFFIIGLLIPIAVYVLLRKHFLGQTPVLQGKSIGFALLLPVMFIYWGIGPIISLVNKADRNDYSAKLDWAFEMEKQGIPASQELWDAIHNGLEASAFIGGMFIVVMLYVIYALYKRTKSSSKKIFRTVWFSYILSIIVLGAVVYDLSDQFIACKNEGNHIWKIAAGIALAYGLSTLLFYVICNHFFKKKVKRIYEYAGTFDTPLPFTNGSAEPVAKAEMTSTSAAPQQETKSRTELLLELKSLLDAGILTQEEFDAQKKEILNS